MGPHAGMMPASTSQDACRPPPARRSGQGRDARREAAPGAAPEPAPPERGVRFSDPATPPSIAGRTVAPVSGTRNGRGGHPSPVEAGEEPGRPRGDLHPVAR